MPKNKFETKTYRGKMQFKGEGENGQFEAVFATLNVIDHDEDVTLPGAFGKQDVLIEPWNHDWSLPVGSGMIREDDEEAIVDGRFFLDIPAAKDHYIVAKELQGKQEWSYTFRILEWKQGEFEGRKVRFLEKLEVIAVSQVSKGAGINTRTTAIKALKDLLGDSKDDENLEDTPGSHDPGASLKRPEAAQLDPDDLTEDDDPDGEPESEAGNGNESGDDPEAGADPATYQTLIDIELEEMS